MLIGHLASDVDLRQTKSGHVLANFPVATNYYIKDGDNRREMVDYHKIIAWGKLAEICHQYLKKGSPVYIDGQLRNRSFDDKEGNRHARVEILLDNINMLTLKSGKGATNQLGFKAIANDTEEVDEAPVETAVA